MSSERPKPFKGLISFNQRAVRNLTDDQRIDALIFAVEAHRILGHPPIEAIECLNLPMTDTMSDRVISLRDKLRLDLRSESQTLVRTLEKLGPNEMWRNVHEFELRISANNEDPNIRDEKLRQLKLLIRFLDLPYINADRIQPGGNTGYSR